VYWPGGGGGDGQTLVFNDGRGWNPGALPALWVGGFGSQPGRFSKRARTMATNTAWAQGGKHGPRCSDTTPPPRHWTHAEPTWHVHVAGSVRSLKTHRPRTKRKGASPRRLPPDLGSNPPSDSHFRTTTAAAERALTAACRAAGLSCPREI
jgi:hypothetical protein